MEEDLQQAVGRIEGKLDTMARRVNEVHRAMHGTNGQPGIRIRVDRIEQVLKGARWLISAIVVALIGAWVKVFGGR